MEVMPFMIPIMALAIPVAAIVFSGIQKVMKLRIEEARVLRTGDQGDVGGEMEVMRDDIARLQEELADVQERLDFAERALVQREHRPQLPDGPTSSA